MSEQGERLEQANAQALADKQQAESVQAALQTQVRQASEMHRTLQVQLDELQHQVANKAARHVKVTSLSVPATALPVATSGDADIDHLIADIAPFFAERAITYVDVGAYVGDVFLKLSQTKALRMREAHLYEPNPLSYQTLSERTKASALPTLHAYQLAVGASAGACHFSSARSMTRITDTADATRAISNTFQAERVTLDEQVRNFTDGRINLLKIDVEGHEREVLEGAQQLLRQQAIDLLYIEVGFNRSCTQQTYFAEIDLFLQERGYRVFRIYEQMNEWIADSPLLRRCNFAYMSERFARDNPFKLVRRLQALQQEVRRLQTAT